MTMTLPAQHEVTVWDVTHSDTSEMLAGLAQQGLVVNQDFEFGFRPAWVNYEEGAGENRRSLTLRFRDPTWATWFRLRYP